MGYFVFGHVTFVVGEGVRVRFCHGSWCGHTPSKELYPDLFACSVDKKASASDLLDHHVGREIRSRNVIFTGSCTIGNWIQ